MSRRRKSFPSYVLHRKSGRARATWTDIFGVPQQRLLPGLYESPESRNAFARLVNELATNPIPATLAGSTLAVVELFALYLEHAKSYYGADSKEIARIASAIKPARELYGSLPAVDFGPKKLAAVRESMIRLGWCRSLINKRIDLIKRAYRWASSEELVPVAAYHALKTLSGLRAGKTDARESEPVRPVADELVIATLPHLRRHVRAMVELMWLTGMRPSEVCTMTLAQIDRTGELWMYKPTKHKTQSRGKVRVIPLGPKSQAVLVAHLEGRILDLDAPVFSPAVARDEHFAAIRAKRKSKVQPSQTSRKKAKPKRLPAMWYSTGVIEHAVRAAAKRAGVEHWFPYQLRHAHGTKVRRVFGLEAAGASLGHSKMSATEVYAERDESLAAEIARKIG